MSFDARSRERLEALGRTLPQKLPPPPRPQAPADSAPPPPSAARHRLEREEDPQALFHALMQASPDGTVPAHLLERLRSLEQTAPRATNPAGARDDSGTSAATLPAAPRPGRSRTERSGRGPAARAAGSDRDLYDAFEDLLRSESDDGPDPLPPPPPRRQADSRLLPRPTLRSERPL